MAKRFLILIMALVVILLGGCGAQQSDSASTTPTQEPEPGITDDTILIGANAPLSGPYAAYGTIIKDMEAYYQKVNDEGGINGRKIKFVYYDDAYDPSKTVGVMKKLVENDNVFLVSTCGASCSMAVADYLAEKKVPVVGTITGNSQILTYPNVFGIQPNFSTDAMTITQYALENFGAKKVGVWYQNDDYGKEALGAIQAELKRNGLEPAVEIPYSTTDVDFSIPVMKFKDVNPDTIILISNTKMCAAFLKQSAELGLKTKFITNSPTADISVSKLAGSAAEGVVFSAFFPLLDDDSNPKVKAHKDFVTKYVSDKTPNTFTLYGQLNAEFVVEALKRAGKDLTREKVITAIESMKNWNGGLQENVSFAPDQHGPGGESLYFIKIENGKFVRIK